MSDTLNEYASLIFRASGRDLLAIQLAIQMEQDPRQHARLAMHGCRGVLKDLAAVTGVRFMQQSGDHVRVGPEHLELLQNPVVQELFPRVRELCHPR